MGSQRKCDGEYGPGTIESDDEIENYSGSGSDSEDEIKQRQKIGGVKDFFQDFDFVETVKDYHRDSWEDVLEYIKTPRERDVSARIARIRQEELKKEKVDSDSKGAESESPENLENTDEIFVPDPAKKDALKVRELDLKRKEKIKDRPIKDKRTKEQIQQDEENAKFFEDAPPVNYDITFLEMNLSRSLLKAIDSLGYETPTPIQAATIPVALQGRDICGCAATGTGKTAAFMLPILERLIYRPPDDAVTRVLVLLPTRELCVQVFQVTKDLSKYTNIDTALSVGGLDLRTQVARLKTMPDIVIATPGRLLDHLKNTPNFGIDGVEILVLDEADRLLDEHFEEQMKDIMNQCSAKRQTMLFSATMTDKVQKLALVSLKNPVKVFVDSNTDVARNLRQEFIRLRSQASREAVLAYLVTRTFSHHTMVFVPRKALCHRFVIMLGFLGIKAGELHANLKQTERLLSLQKFKEGENGVLIATDVAARGLDIKGVKTVINYTLPKTYARYVHRVGRTARAGHGGRSITLAADNEYSMLREIKKCSKSALFERVIDKDILDAYTMKLVKVEPLIKKVFEEEQEEKKLRMMEEAVNKMEKKLKDTGGKEKKSERNWCKDEFEDKLNRKHMRAQRKLLAFTLGKKKGPGKPVKQPDDPRLKDKMNRQVQKAKKAMKTQRLRTDHEKEIVSAADNSKNKKVKRNKRKGSSFDQELTSIDRKSVKKFRAGPSYEEKKEAFEKKYPGKKFKPIRR